MQKSDSAQSIKVVRRQVQPSTTLNRRYVTPPKNPSRRIKVNVDSSSSSQTAKTVSVPKSLAQPTASPRNLTAPKKAAVTPVSTTTKPTPEQLKELAIKKALRSASKDPEPTAHPHKLHFGLGRIVLAFACTTAAIFALFYFINANAGLSIVNAAKEAGIEISGSPKVPTGFDLTDIVSEEGKLTLNYSNPSIKASFSIVEERSSWDSNALLTNYVKPTYDDNFTIVRENGLTIYVSDSNAAWVSGRIVHKIITHSGSLTKKQIRTIAASLNH